MRAGSFVPVILAIGLTAGCTTFGAPRSAVVRPGTSFSAQLTGTSRLSDEAGWFWSFDCEAGCSHIIIAPEASLTFGEAAKQGTPMALELGVSGISPFADGYLQLGRGTHPWGIGSRIAPVWTWPEFLFYGRVDLPAGDGERVLWNPGLFLKVGNSPNGANPGSFVGLVQTLGLEADGERVAAAPAFSIVVARAHRSSYGVERHSGWTAFVVFSIRMTVHRRNAGTSQ